MAEFRFRPMLAAAIETEEDYLKLQYPMYASPKLDGIRCVTHPILGPVSRSLKPIPNDYIREYLAHPMLKYLDGEIVVGPGNAPDVFNKTQSAVMTRSGTPDFTFLVFDHIGTGNLPCPYSLRMHDAEEAVRLYTQWHNDKNPDQPSRIQYLMQERIETRHELDYWEEICCSSGYEGLMLRIAGGRYKYNRSTLREGLLLKLKRFVDAEAEIIGWEPLMSNNNIPYLDERGYQKRSYHQDGKKADATRIGAFIGRVTSGQFTGEVVKCGSGLDDDNRLRFRKLVGADGDPGAMKGKIFTFKFQPHGSKDKPRAPIWKGLRHD